jgi:glyoxylase-like metal-dependent hydrolase (beta-lactamase superfamily II)
MGAMYRKRDRIHILKEISYQLNGRSNFLLLEGSHLRIRKYNSRELQIYNGNQLRISHTQSISLKTGAFIINAPGHLQGHINLLARTGPKNWVYLAGDACHDRRLLRGELSIAEWEKDGKVCCIHVDKGMTEETLERIKGLERGGGVEVILAHDREWIDARGNEERFWPGKL